MKWSSYVTLYLLVVLTAGCAALDGVDDSALKNTANTTNRAASTVRPGQTATLAPVATFTPPDTLVPLNTTPTDHPAPMESTATSLPPPTIRPVPEFKQAAIPPNALAPTLPITDIAGTEELVAYGLQVYKEQYCGVCHKLDVAATGGLFGPEQNGIGSTAAQRIQDPKYSGTATTAADYIRESIVSPQAYLVEGFEQSRHHMPAFTHLNENELNALVQMLLQQQ